MNVADQFRSLFLPLAEHEPAIFAEICPPLTSLRCGPASGSNVRSSSYSPASGRDEDDTTLLSEASNVNAKGGSRIGRRAASSYTSPLLAQASHRADVLLVVLQSRQVVLFSLRDRQSGPKEIRRFQPTPTKEEFEKLRTQQHQGRKNAVSGAIATCASLFPLELVYLCRIVPSQAGTEVSAGSFSRRIDAPPSVYLRGVIGCSDGRVEVFTDSSFAFSFAAHDCPVVRVEAFHPGPHVLQADNDQAVTTARSASPDLGDENSQASSSPSGRRQRRRKLLQHGFTDAMPLLGFVTSGEDGMVYVWRRSGDSFSPEVLMEGGVFARQAAFCLFHPSVLDWLTPSYTPRDSRIDPSYLPRTFVVRASGKAELKCHTLVSSSESTTISRRHPLRIPLEGGGWMSRVSAIAANDRLVLVARKRELIAFNLLRDKRAMQGKSHVFTCEDVITSISIDDGIAIASCEKTGRLEVVQLEPFTHLGTYFTYENRSPTSVRLHAPSLLLTVVDHRGSVELVRLPDAYHNALRRSNYSSRLLTYLPAAQSLRCRQCAEEIEAHTHQAAGEGSHRTLGSAAEIWHERWHLNRFAIPLAAEQNLHQSVHIF